DTRRLRPRHVVVHVETQRLVWAFDKKPRQNASVPYMPSLRLSFPAGIFNDYRLNRNQVELRTGNGAWRTLDEGDIQLHHAFHTEVSRWLVKELGNPSRTGS